MATNNLTPEQDILARRFFLEVAQEPGLVPNSPPLEQQLRAILLAILNYQQLPNGNFVKRGTEIILPFGSSDYSAYPCEWAADYQRAVDALSLEELSDAEQITTEEIEEPEIAGIEDSFAIYSDDNGEASTGVETPSTEVREAILPEDV
jgi:hypothetical protein